MKLFHLLFLILIIPIHSSAQSFSGEIEFEISFIAKNDSVNIDSLRTAYLGDRLVYIITDGNYRNSYYKNDEYVYSYTYDNISKRMYDDEVAREFITYRDSRKTNMTELNSHIY